MLIQSIHEAMVDGLIAILKVLFSTKNLKRMNKYVLPTVRGLCVVTGIAGFLAVFGGIGTWDYYAEIGQIVPAAEEKAATITIIAGIFGFAASCSIGYLAGRLILWNKDVMRIRHKKYLAYKRKRIERMRWTIGDFLYKNHIAVDRDSIMYDYTYGEPAMIRRVKKRVRFKTGARVTTISPAVTK
jgi:hypothetical protein